MSIPEDGALQRRFIKAALRPVAIEVLLDSGLFEDADEYYKKCSVHPGKYFKNNPFIFSQNYWPYGQRMDCNPEPRQVSDYKSPAG